MDQAEPATEDKDSKLHFAPGKLSRFFLYIKKTGLEIFSHDTTKKMENYTDLRVLIFFPYKN